MSDSLKRSGRPRALRVDTDAPTQVRHPWRAVLRTIIAAIVGVVVTALVNLGLDLRTFAPDMVESLTSVVWLAGTAIGQWMLTLPGVNAWLARFLPILSPTPRPRNEWPDDDLDDPTGVLTDSE